MQHVLFSICYLVMPIRKRSPGDDAKELWPSQVSTHVESCIQFSNSQSYVPLKFSKSLSFQEKDEDTDTVPMPGFTLHISRPFAVANGRLKCGEGCGLKFSNISYHHVDHKMV